MLAIGAGGLLAGTANGAEQAQVNLTNWTPPSIGTVGDDPLGKLVKYAWRNGSTAAWNAA
jgi:hypothetical protein